MKGKAKKFILKKDFFGREMKEDIKEGFTFTFFSEGWVNGDLKRKNNERNCVILGRAIRYFSRNSKWKKKRRREGNEKGSEGKPTKKIKRKSEICFYKTNYILEGTLRKEMKKEGRSFFLEEDEKHVEKEIYEREACCYKRKNIFD